MSKLDSLLAKAKSSKFYLKVLNIALNGAIPFNKPHGFKVIEVSDTHLKTMLPYKRRNFNHIKGLHACALATLSEFTTGLLLASKLDAKEYRLILKTLEMEYHYQGKMEAYAFYEITDNTLEQQVIEPLQRQDAIIITCEVKIHDKNNNHLSTGQVHWQIKAWKKVKTKVN